MEEKTVRLYQGGRSLVKKSGVGCAMGHQEAALRAVGEPFLEYGENYGVLHLNTVFPDSYWMARRARRAGKKVIYHAHSTMEDFEESFIGSNTLAPFFKKWICCCYNQADLVLTPTPYSRELLRSYGLKPPVMNVSNGVDTDFFQKKPEQRYDFRQKYGLSMEQKVVLSVGLPIERKGILEFIQMAENFPEYEFFWFGEIPSLLRTTFVKRAMRQAPKNCHFPGFVPKRELRDAYGGSDAFLFLSSEETEGIVLLEALSMELPIIARKTGAYEGWLTDGENACVKAEFSELKESLWEILEGRREPLTGKGRETAVERNLKSIGQRLVTVYRSLYNRKG